MIGSLGLDWSYESLVNELSKYNYSNLPIFEKSPEEILDEFQTGLDMCGMVPGFGEPFDAVNALISIGRGDLVAAAFSIGAFIPVAGTTSTVLKWGNKAGNKLLNSPIKISPARWQHMFDRHINPNIFTLKSKFDFNVDVNKLIQDAT